MDTLVVYCLVGSNQEIFSTSLFLTYCQELEILSLTTTLEILSLKLDRQRFLIREVRKQIIENIVKTSVFLKGDDDSNDNQAAVNDFDSIDFAQEVDILLGKLPD